MSTNLPHKLHAYGMSRKTNSNIGVNGVQGVYRRIQNTSRPTGVHQEFMDLRKNNSSDLEQMLASPTRHIALFYAKEHFECNRVTVGWTSDADAVIGRSHSLRQSSSRRRVEK